MKQTQRRDDVSHVRTGYAMGWLVVTLSASALCGCPLEAKKPAGPPLESTSKQHQPDRAQVLIETDLRRHDVALAISFLRADPERRALAARGLGRMVDSESALVLLQRGLADPEPAVRAEVSFGLSLAGLPLDAWIGAYAVESDPSVADLMLQDLGRALDLQRAGPLLRPLEGEGARSACIGINRMLERDPHLPPEIVRRLLVLANSPDEPTAVACLVALVALERASVAPVATLILEQAAANLAAKRYSNPETRLAWLRLVARCGTPAITTLAAAADDPDPSVASLAFEELAVHGGSGRASFTRALETRLARYLRGEGAEADPIVIHAALNGAAQLGDSVEQVAWLASLLDRLNPQPEAPPATTRGSLHCAAARAFDRVRKWPSRSPGCGLGVVPDWLGHVAAAEILSHAEGSDALRVTQFRRLFDQGDWHVKHAVMRGLHNISLSVVTELLLEGLSHDHPQVRSAALESLARLAPRLRSAGAALPNQFAGPLRAAFQSFHVKHDVRGLRAFLNVVRMARLRAELGPVTVLAHSGIGPVRRDARALLEEWGHPLPDQPTDPVPNPVSRETLVSEPNSFELRTRDGAIATLTLDPQLAPVTASRLIQWLRETPPTLEASDRRPGRHVLLTATDGIPSLPMRSEESRASLVRGSVIVPSQDRDALGASLLILLAPAPALEGRVTVVGHVRDGLPAIDSINLGDTLQVRGSSSDPTP